MNIRMYNIDIMYISSFLKGIIITEELVKCAVIQKNWIVQTKER